MQAERTFNGDEVLRRNDSRSMYSSPKIVEYGSLADVTRDTASGPNDDSGTVPGLQFTSAV